MFSFVKGTWSFINQGGEVGAVYATVPRAEGLGALWSAWFYRNLWPLPLFWVVQLQLLGVMFIVGSQG